MSVSSVKNQIKEFRTFTIDGNPVDIDQFGDWCPVSRVSAATLEIFNHSAPLPKSLDLLLAEARKDVFNPYRPLEELSKRNIFPFSAFTKDLYKNTGNFAVAIRNVEKQNIPLMILKPILRLTLLVSVFAVSFFAMMVGVGIFLELVGLVGIGTTLFLFLLLLQDLCDLCIGREISQLKANREEFQQLLTNFYDYFKTNQVQLQQALFEPDQAFNDWVTKAELEPPDLIGAEYQRRALYDFYTKLGCELPAVANQPQESAS